MRRITRKLLFVVLMMVLAVAGDSLGCPNCKEALANQDGDAMRLANGYSWSIILMIAMPFTILSTGMMMVARAIKRGALPEM